jgi:hypothetical protein
MIRVNLVFREGYFNNALEDWLHPEMKEERKRQREERQQKAWAKAREDQATRRAVELMAQVTGGTNYGPSLGRGIPLPTIGLTEQTQ